MNFGYSYAKKELFGGHWVLRLFFGTVGPEPEHVFNYSLLILNTTICIVCQVGVKELRFQYQSVQSSTKMGANLKGGRVFFHLTHTPPHTIKVRYRSWGSGFASRIQPIYMKMCIILFILFLKWSISFLITVHTVYTSFERLKGTVAWNGFLA